MKCSARLRSKIQKLVLLAASFFCLATLVVVVRRRPIFPRSYQPINFQVFSRIPGSFLKRYTPSNHSYCKFNYGLPARFQYVRHHFRYPFEAGPKSSYRILRDVVSAGSTAAPLPPVTYATHVTSDFVNFLPELASSWQGPISVAAFVPHSDAHAALEQLTDMCFCLPEMSRVSVHFVFPLRSPPRVGPPSPRPPSCALKDTPGTFRARSKMSYPVNVCRNAAKMLASTEHVLVSDVELIPSRGVAAKFLDMVEGWSAKERRARVYVLPVFEVERYEEVPRSKEKLVELVKDERAVYFHRHTCFHCQKFPGLENWVQEDVEDVVKPSVVAKREYPFHRWEPIYIGTKNEPLYSEALSWEGKQDKMTQMLEMCLIGYEFVILDGAFLVHWPGIKRKSAETKIRNKWRSPYQLRNSRQYTAIINTLYKKYDKNPKC